MVAECSGKVMCKVGDLFFYNCDTLVFFEVLYMNFLLSNDRSGIDYSRTSQFHRSFRLTMQMSG